MLRPILIAGILSCAWALRIPGSRPAPEGRRARQTNTVVNPEEYEGLEGNNKFYKYHDYGASWDMAEEICREEGARLMVINNDLEAELVRKLFDRYPKTRGDARSSAWAWVGVAERGTNNRYYSVNGEPLDQIGYYEWYPGYPELPGANNCVVVERATGALADDYCGRRYSFICESDTNPAAAENSQNRYALDREPDLTLGD